jgi:hypothetical protein
MASTKTSFDINKCDLDPTFQMDKSTWVTVHDKGRTIVGMFDGTMNNTRIFNLREIYEQYGVWKPGKGISVAIDRKHQFLKELQDGISKILLTTQVG